MAARAFVKRIIGRRGQEWYGFARHVRDDFQRFSRPEPRIEYRVAPHPMSAYEAIIRAYAESPACRFIRMRDLITRDLNPHKLNVVLRHDVDAFPERNHLFYAIERRWHVPSAFYILLSECDYDAAAHADELKELARAGFEIGLHTTAWGREDAVGFFRNEMATFRSILGCYPETFTLHGYLPWSDEVVRLRARFMALVPQLLAEFPDCIGTDYGRPDDYTISDSAFMGEISRWPAAPPPLDRVGIGGTVKVLTHPNYWPGDELKARR